jgi:hypothetical protein
MAFKNGSNPYMDDSVTPGVNYCYRVRAVKGAGASAYIDLANKFGQREYCGVQRKWLLDANGNGKFDGPTVANGSAF